MNHSSNFGHWAFNFLIAGLLLGFMPVDAYSAVTRLTAKAGVNQTVLVNRPVTLSGSASNVRGSIRRWYWQQIAGAKVKLNGSTSAKPRFTSPAQAGTLRFMLTVTDASNAKAYSLVSVTVVPGAPRLSLVAQNFTANQAIAAGQSRKLTWTVRNDSGYTLCPKFGTISQCKVAITKGVGNGGLAYGAISPASIDNWANGQSKTFSVIASTPSNVAAGNYNQSWRFSYDGGQRLLVNNNANGLQARLTVPQTLRLSLLNAYYDNQEAYVAGGFLSQGTSRTLQWLVKNDSNVVLNNVVLTPGSASGHLSIGNISPASVSRWGVGESKTFSVLLTVPVDDLGGSHAQSWRLSYGNNLALALANNQSIGFGLNTPNPDIHLSLIRRYFENNAPVNDGSEIAQGSSRTVKWDIQNNSSVVLSNVSLSPRPKLGTLTIGNISPANIDNWAIGETKTFAVNVIASADTLSGRHGRTWNLAVAGSPASLDNNQSVNFSLTTAPLECKVAANPAPASPGLRKLSAAGQAIVASSAQWSCVKDQSSGLIWELKTNDGGLRDKDRTYSWDGAQAYANTVNAQGLCGASNWRVPTAEELLTLIGAKSVGSPINAQRLIDYDFFPNTVASDYWSASDSVDDNAWGVSFSDGGYAYLDKNAARFVRLVRDAN